MFAKRSGLMKSKAAEVKRILWLILLANVLVASVKIVLGQVIKSSSMTADGFHSLTDGSANLVGLIAVFIAAKPVDENHPYGHKKFETLAGLLISVFLFFLGGNILFHAVRGFNNPVVPEITGASLLILLITLGINTIISVYELKAGERLGSNILIADSYHTRSDIYISLGVLITLAGIKLGLPAVIDSVVSLVVVVFIFHAAGEILLPTCGVLADQAVFDRSVIAKMVSEFAEVKDVHEIRSRGREDDRYIDLHIELDPAMSVEESHYLIHKIEYEIRTQIGVAVQVLIHVEPYRRSLGNMVLPLSDLSSGKPREYNR